MIRSDKSIVVSYFIQYKQENQKGA